MFYAPTTARKEGNMLGIAGVRGSEVSTKSCASFKNRMENKGRIPVLRL